MRLSPLLALLFLSTPVLANPTHKTVLDNGLTVLIQEMPAAQTVSIYAYIKTGSTTEGKYLGAGISHFVEHMLFKGTAKRGVGQIAQEVKNLGGTVNAHTSFDHTMYTLDLPKEQFKQGLDIISDMVMNSTFDPVQVDKEREVIRSEMRLYNDRPDRKLSELVFKNVYLRHPYRHPIIGYITLFDQITRDQMYEYYKSRYIPNNMIISIAGAVDQKEILPLVEATFKNFQPLPYPDRHVPQEPPQISKRFYEETYPTPLYRFSLSYQGVGMLDPDLYAMDVLAMALGQGQSSRLYEEIYHKKHLVESISSSNFTPLDQGVFEIEGMMSQNHLSKVLSEIQTIVTDIQHHGLTTQELERTKRQVLSQFVFGNQTPSSLAYRNAADEAVTGDVLFSQHYVDAVKAVTNDDIRRVANRYFNEAQSTLVVLTPPHTEPQEEKQTSSAAKQAIEKIVLDNGLTLLLQEDNAVDVLSITMVMNAGTRQETDANNGISQLMANVWSKALAPAMEQHGGGLDTFTGKNTAGIKINVLSDDAMFALDTLEKLIKTPVLTPQVIDEERQNMYASIDARDDDISSATFKELSQTLFLKHPYRLDPLGTKESLKSITPQDISAYYRHFAAPNNMVISVFGHFDQQSVLEILKKKFAPLPRTEVVLPSFHEESITSTRQKDLSMDKEQAMLAYSFQAPALSNKDRFAMEIIDGILGSGLSGRFFIKVRDESSKAYTVGSDYVPGIDTGVFSVYALTTNDKIESVRSLIQGELESLQKNPVSQAELSSVKNYLKGTYILGLDTPAALGFTCALNELYGLGYDFHQKYSQAIDAVSSADIQRVAKDYLDIHKSAMVLTKGATKDK